MAGYISSEYIINAEGSSIDTSLASIPKTNSTNANPTVTNDGTQGYLVGSWWYNTATQTWYVCTSNATGAAVWLRTALEQSQPLNYKGTWNATTNTPTLVNGAGSNGDFYLCTVAGTANFGAGGITFVVGDMCAYGGGAWGNAGTASTLLSVGVKAANIASLGAGQSTQVTTTWTYPFTSTQYINTFDLSKNDQGLPVFSVEVSHSTTTVTYNVFNPNNTTLTNIVVGIIATISGN